jgi:hypothetical protein
MIASGEERAWDGQAATVGAGRIAATVREIAAMGTSGLQGFEKRSTTRCRATSIFQCRRSGWQGRH